MAATTGNDTITTDLRQPDTAQAPDTKEPDHSDCQPGESAHRAFRDIDGQMPDDLFYD